mmetsp:Transcript_10774/g.21914  ORF Transcript_10774/g.21914 Transcript_10774/m.21914 type:complete len:143 (+) Transcript_10774:464-892(+)
MRGVRPSLGAFLFFPPASSRASMFVGGFGRITNGRRVSRYAPSSRASFSSAMLLSRQATSRRWLSIPLESFEDPVTTLAHRDSRGSGTAETAEITTLQSGNPFSQWQLAPMCYAMPRLQWEAASQRRKWAAEGACGQFGLLP